MNARVNTATIHVLDLARHARHGTHGRMATRVAPSRRRPVCRDQLFVQVILCESRPDLVGRTWSCRTATVDGQRIGFLSEQPLPADALVDLWLDLADRPGKIFLSGQVDDCREAEDTRHRIDIRLDDGAATDIDTWRSLVG